MPTHINRQIEQIADEAISSEISVIIQMEGEEDLSSFLEATTEAINQRRSMISARELVPPSKNALKTTETGRLTSAARRTLSSEYTSQVSSTFLASLELKKVAEKALKAMAARAMRPLFESHFVKTVIQKRLTHSHSNNSPPTHFWSSNAALLRVTKEELCQIPKNVPRLAAIFPNRDVRVPPVSRSEGLPAAVEDDKGYTWGISRTGAMAAWGAFEARGAGVKVAVLDTGVDARHPDLADRVAAFAEFGPDGTIIAEGVEKAYDKHGHGTHCAGTIAGRNASGRWIGMAPSAEIISAMVLKDGFGTDAQILAGFDWAITAGANVISLSLGSLRMAADVLDTYSLPIITANRLGIPVVVAVGNNGGQTSGSPGNDFFAYTVGATDFLDRTAGFSGGRTQIIESSRYIDPKYLPVVYSKPEVTAPGVEIYSAVPGGKWESWNGTSMATPHVAGALALLLGKPCTIIELAGLQRVNLLQTLLSSTVKEIGEAGQDHRFGYGRIDVLRALGYARDRGYWSK